jgi:predicted signal transduction protein with EAL and GGDEF domain
VFASASIGISLYPQDGESPAALQKHADAAMYRAKFRGKSCYEFFTEELAVPRKTSTRPSPSDRSAPPA